MRTETEIRARLDELHAASEHLLGRGQSVATTDVNSTRALDQCAASSRCREIRWVLGEEIEEADDIDPSARPNLTRLVTGEEVLAALEHVCNDIGRLESGHYTTRGEWTPARLAQIRAFIEERGGEARKVFVGDDWKACEENGWPVDVTFDMDDTVDGYVRAILLIRKEQTP